ncbi:peptidoglycan DD-metalloendopeptidase family protein [Vibrio gangliei]|uniref:peptidoglycan DD-metalloendopeptidase family protein n=1 Tax=Vibrio gangliei TaxID=2077090 RepID=UPI000D01F236|nr:peptidoglycan DD-metalloendopeptidase family protein [Vibrio gangliei]
MSIEHQLDAFEQTLKQHEFHPVIVPELQFGKGLIVDLSPSSEIWKKVTDEHDFSAEIKRQVAETGAVVEIGRYAEQRMIYQDTENFEHTESRTLHIGLDLGIPAGNSVFAPIQGEVVAFANRQIQGDYGPVIILRHQLEGHIFHTLYGHLATSSLQDLYIGKIIQAGEAFATIGTYDENGGWATHLHFQIIRDLGEYLDDYPGVVDPKQADFYLRNCPNPNWILGRSDLA